MTTMERCGVCGLLPSVLRRFICGGKRRTSSDSCYRPLGDQERLKESDSDESIHDAIQGTAAAADLKRSVSVTFHEHVIEFYNEGLSEDWVEKPLITRRFGSPQTGRRRWNIPAAHLLDELYVGRLKEMLRRHRYWNFDTTLLDSATGGRCLPVLGMHLLRKHDLINIFELRPEFCWNFLVMVEESYHHDNPYHNSVHAADVTQAIHCFLTQKSLRNRIPPLEVLVALLAAMTHDLDHPGFNAQHLITTAHPISLLYKDDSQVAIEVKENRQPIKKGVQRMKKFMRLWTKTPKSPANQAVAKTDEAGPSGSTTGIKLCKLPEKLPPILEHHHWRMAYSCILQSKIFAHMPEKLPVIKTMLKSLILATDITRQSQYIAKFKDLIEKKKLKMDKDEHRHLVLQMALKTADISNPGRTWNISRTWSMRVCSEFYQQGDMERVMNLPITNLCDRFNDTIPNIQKGFYTFIVLPLYRQWNSFAKDSISRMLIENLQANQHNWEKIQLEGLGLSVSLNTSMSSNHISSANAVRNLLDSSTISSASDMPFSDRRCSMSPVKSASKVRDTKRRWSDPFEVYTSLDSSSRGSRALSRTQRDSIQEVESPAPDEGSSPESDDMCSALHSPTPAPPNCDLSKMTLNFLRLANAPDNSEGSNSESVSSPNGNHVSPQSNAAALFRLLSASRISHSRSTDANLDLHKALPRRGSVPATSPPTTVKRTGRRASEPVAFGVAARVAAGVASPDHRIIIPSLNNKVATPAHVAR